MAYVTDENDNLVRPEYFANTVAQLKASVECAKDIEAKIQDALDQHEIYVEKDHVSQGGSGKWLALIVHPYESGIDFVAATEGGASITFWRSKLLEMAADGSAWIGFGSPEVALATAMVDFRRTQLRLLGLPA